MSDQPSHRQTRSIEIPEGTADTIAARLTETEFESIDEYVTFALEQLLTELQRQQDADQSPTPQGNGDRAHEDDVETRLDSLGYL